MSVLVCPLFFSLVGKFTTSSVQFHLDWSWSKFLLSIKLHHCLPVFTEIQAKQCSQLRQTEVESRLEGCQYSLLQDSLVLSIMHSLSKYEENNFPLNKPLRSSSLDLSIFPLKTQLVFGGR